MAESSDPNDKKVVTRRSSGKSPGKPKDDKRNRKSQDKTCGFHPLQSLRNIFFGPFRKEKPLLENDDEEKPADSATGNAPARAKSSDDIVDQVRREDSSTSTASCLRRPPKSSNPMGKQLSVSADNLLSDEQWIPAPHGIPTVVVTSSAGMNSSESESSILSASFDEVTDAAREDGVEDFFSKTWTQHDNSKPRSYSSSDADGVDTELDLDSVPKGGALDVSASKTRLAIKPQGKRLTLVMEEKLKKADVGPRPPSRPPPPQLQSLVEEADESADSAVHGATRGNELTEPQPNQSTVAPPVAPRRREKNVLLPPEKTNYRQTIGFGVTPEMLNVALKKPVDRNGSVPKPRLSTGSSDANTPPGVGSRKVKAERDGAEPETDNRKTGTEEQGSSNDRRAVSRHDSGGTTGGLSDGLADGVRGTTASTAVIPGGATVPCVALPRKPVPCLPPPAGEKDFKGARPKEPPKAPPKTRPKTILHAAPAQALAPQMDPEWMTRSRKTSTS